MAHQTGLYPSPPEAGAQQQFQNTAHQQAWQQAYQGMLAAATPSFEGTRSSTPLASHPNIGQLRSVSASSVTSNNPPSSASANGSNPTFHPYRRQPGNMKRSRSSDNSLSNSSRAAETSSIIANRQGGLAPSITSPSDTIVQTPNTIEHYRERARVESNGSTDSRSTVSEGGKIGVAVRAGRIPVPKLMDVTEGIHVAQGQRSVSTPVAQPQRESETEAFTRSSSNNDLSHPNTYNANQFSHKRQSSSTSSVGAVVRSTLGQGSNSTFATGTSASTPPSLVIASSSLTTPLAPVVSPERPARTMNNVPVANQGRDKSESASSGGGLKSRLQRALNKNSEKEKPRAPVISAPVGEMRQGGLTASGSAPSSLPQQTGTTGRSVSNPQQAQQQHPGLGNRRPSNSSFAPSFIEPLNGNAGKGKRNLFSMRNASTDNISIGSTVSSASMMIRKMGALGKLARRNSMAGISKIFKNKDDEDGVIMPEPKARDDMAVEKSKGDKKKKRSLFGGSKSQPANSSTSFATANGAAAVSGDDLTPAAKLARQHTLRTKADEARKAAAAARAARQSPPEAAYGDESTVRTLETGAPAEEVDDVDQVAAQLSQFSLAADDTPNLSAEAEQYGDALEGMEEEDFYRSDDADSMEEDRSDDEGEILRAPTTVENNRLNPQQWPRLRAKSSENIERSEPGPLVKIPSQDPDHLDGKSNKHASTYDPFSQSFSPFESQMDREPFADRLNFPYANFAMNSSAPVLTSMGVNPPNGGKPYRSLTAPPVQKRNINWAPECAIYHTFHAEVYDRRSEPATCNRLTPQLAQQIKDELNGYKMEEMDVHPSSRIHTHFL
ncbi:hypothetical protein QFC21_003435 [Naganishia friedmannii]|uniref:Uncharacterized protein n=1 Tax=Naganishia friedmannii TaxID=89922 RepID=A0ACC2VRG3_9TREE|nr:hypothetical protein QFC21_003435 [Naganishia friedmannii]